MKRPSIRARLLLWTTILTTLILVGAGYFLYQSVSRTLYEQQNQLLAEAATVVMIEVEVKNREVYHEWKESLETHPWQQSTALIQVTDYHSGELVRSEALSDFNLENRYGELGERVFYDLLLPDGSMGRAVGILTLPIVEYPEGNEGFDPESRPQIFVWAENTKNLHKIMNRLRRSFIISGIAVLILLWGAIWMVISLSSRAVRAVSDEMISREGSEMGQPISIPDNLPSEVAILAEIFNVLLAKIDTSREKDRDFFLNLAHEVRTPLAGVRAEIEQALRKPRENDDYRRRLERALEGTEGLNTLVNRLMKFGSLRRKESNLAFEQVDISSLLKRIWRAFEPRAEERRLKVEWRLEDKVEIHSDVELLKIIISNLLENAISYSVEGSSIRVKVEAASSNLNIVVENAVEGPEVSSEDLEKFFDPFYRGDQSRAQVGNHAGIGLSFSREIVALLGGAIRVSQVSADRIAFEVSLPR
jgi:signal transduction histidine kinase